MLERLMFKNRDKACILLIIAIIASFFSYPDFSPVNKESRAVRNQSYCEINCSVKKAELPPATDEIGQRFTETSVSENVTHKKALKNVFSFICVNQEDVMPEAGECETGLTFDALYSENLKIVNYLHDSDGMKG